MKNNENSLLFSLLLSMNSKEEHEVTLEDLMYSYSREVTNCQIKMYQLVIEWLSSGMSYEDISRLIDNIDIEEYRRLNGEQQQYIQRKLRKDLKARENNEEKNKGVIKYE